MKLPLVLRLALLVSCLETVRGTPVDQKEKLFALVRIKLEVSFWFLFFINYLGNTANRYEINTTNILSYSNSATHLH